MHDKFSRLSGMMASVICVISYFVFSTLNDEYYHFTKAFSELSSVGQANALWFSILGFLIPGLLITYFCFKLPSVVNNGDVNRIPFILLSLSGFLIALGASPMNYQDFSSVSSSLHIIGVMGSGLVFMIGVFTISRQLKKDDRWKPFTKILLALAWLLIVTGFFRGSQFPGLAQKLGILSYYVYIFILSWRAYKIPMAIH